MATSLSSSLTMALNAPYLNTLSDSIVVTDALSKAFADSMTNGSSSEQVQYCYHGLRTLGASTAETLNLFGGLTDAFGNTLNFASIKLLWMNNTTTTAGFNLTVGAAASHPWETWSSVAGSTFLIAPNGIGLIYAPQSGFTVTNGSSQNLKVNNGNAGSVSYELIILGA